MRVIAGSARGQPLKAPRDPGVRPISDRAKETLFGIIGHRVRDARVLDLYAGSGAIGIEALSRGAASATFVERGRAGLVAIRGNLERTRLADRAEVHGHEVLAFLDGLPSTATWDLVILDPPYAERTLDRPLARLAPHLAAGGLVAVKHFWKTPIPSVSGLSPTRTRRLGETAISFLEPASVTAAEEPI